MKQYLALLEKILHEGRQKKKARENMPDTIGISHGIIQMDLQEGFPLLTTKKMHFRGIVTELLWFLKGETNVKSLVDQGVNIWNDDAYRWYCKYACANNTEINSILRDNGDNTLSMFTYDEFVAKMKEIDKDKLPRVYQWEDGQYNLIYTFGDLGKVYGYQWRNQNGVDQVKEVFNSLKSNPDSRYHIIDSWNKADFPEMALPPCHLLYQFICRPLTPEERKTLTSDSEESPKYFLDLNMYQRSCDTMLGVPYNIASMSLLLMIYAKATNMLPGVSTWIGGDTHLYVNHIPLAIEQTYRTPFQLPKVEIKKELKTLDDILELTTEDFVLSGYESHPAIKADLFTGIIK